MGFAGRDARLPGAAAARAGRLRLLPRLRAGAWARVARRHDPGGRARARADADLRRDRRPGEHRLRDHSRARPCPDALPRPRARQRRRRPSARALAGGHRSLALPAVRARRLARRACRPRSQGPVQPPGNRPRHDVRLDAVRRARGRAGAARDRDRAGAGGRDARRSAVPDLSQDHVACDSLGGRVRRGAHDGARDRRVRRRQRRRRHEADPAPLRAGRGRELRYLWRVRRLGRARADRDRDRGRPARLPPERGDRLMAGIAVLDVTKRFNGFTALKDVSVVIPEGSLTALLGPSGSGKSTLLRVIAGLEEPDAGQVMIGGDDVTQQPARARGVGMVFQHYAAFKHMTVWDNVAFGLTIQKRPRWEIKERVHELLELVQLEGLAKRYPAQLSGGQRQRMALARALAVEPSVLLLDEPFGALDARVRKELRAWLRRLHDEVHVTTIIVTHDQEEAMEVAGQIVVLNDGRIEQVGSPRELYDSPANEFVMSFVGPVNKIGNTFVRPRDISLSLEPEGGDCSTEAMVE